MKTATHSPVSKSAKQGAVVLGRSAATGRYVMAPASKGASISFAKASAAVKSLHSQKK